MKKRFGSVQRKSLYLVLVDSANRASEAERELALYAYVILGNDVNLHDNDADAEAFTSTSLLVTNELER